MEAYECGCATLAYALQCEPELYVILRQAGTSLPRFLGNVLTFLQRIKKPRLSHHQSQR
jgi:hypothetical protein